MATSIWAPLLLIVLMGITCGECADKFLIMEMSPSEIYPHCTESLVLRCSVNNTAGGNDGMVIKSTTAVAASNIHWTALIIKKNTVAIASVTYVNSVLSYTPANLYDGSSNIHVGGSLLDSDEECGFLEVTWTDPMYDQKGSYECVANGQSSMGEQFSYRADADVMIDEVMTSADYAMVANLTSQVTSLTAKVAEIAAVHTDKEWAALTNGRFCGENPDVNDDYNLEDLNAYGWLVKRGEDWDSGLNTNDEQNGELVYGTIVKPGGSQVNVTYDGGATSYMLSYRNPGGTEVTLVCLPNGLA